MKEHEPPTDRTRVRRLPERGAYDRATIDAILDAMPVAHVGYSIDGQPFVTPTLQWREGNHVYWHGSAASRMLRSHRGRTSLPYGHPHRRHGARPLGVQPFHELPLRDAARKGPGRQRSRREGGAPQDIRRVAVPRALGHAPPRHRPGVEGHHRARHADRRGSAKVRSGEPHDDEGDETLDIWAGVIPIRYEVLPPVADPHVCAPTGAPPHASAIFASDRRFAPSAALRALRPRPTPSS